MTRAPRDFRFGGPKTQTGQFGLSEPDVKIINIASCQRPADSFRRAIFRPLIQHSRTHVARIYIEPPACCRRLIPHTVFALLTAPAAPRAQNGMSSSMSLLRAPAATARRGALEGPADPKSP